MKDGSSEVRVWDQKEEGEEEKQPSMLEEEEIIRNEGVKLNSLQALLLAHSKVWMGMTTGLAIKEEEMGILAKFS